GGHQPTERRTRLPAGARARRRSGSELGNEGWAGSWPKNFCPDHGLNDMQRPETSGTLNLAFGVHSAPKDAPAKVLRQIESEAQALAVAIRAGGHKLEYVAACIGKSRSYV